ncbi:MAG: UvrD-helicase domain-containing protein [Methanomassiliicoccaceae archaeon]|jgi:ATP-dependent exoDNAse (exonuclease V) beta subunit|nr:UvrD-helicase domain-containing protein [Methanomassiliicoccaceae archaeon]
MTNLNERQQKIAETTDGIVAVDAGPGTGKTHTIVQRYLNILRKEVAPSDILLLTFTNNAALEMEGRVKSEMLCSSADADASAVRSSTFDAFCLRVVMESPETVKEFFKTKETLTRNARLVQNETIDQEYFRNVYTRFIRRYGHIYGNIPAIVGTSASDVYDVIQRLMAIGIAPTHDEGWFGRSRDSLFGDTEKLIEKLSKNTERANVRYSAAANDLPPDRRLDEVTGEMIKEAANDPRALLLRFINGVYYEYIRSSISDNRLTFGLNALFAFIILYSSKRVRKMMSFRYVMVDEFQDTNELQFMISLLILREPNLCAVGDWKQGIYGFRYASVDNMIHFRERLAEMTRFLNKGEKRVVPFDGEPVSLPLTENYRSSQTVIDAAFRTLRCRARKDETIDTAYLDANVTQLTAFRDHGGYTHAERLHAETYDKEKLAILQRITEYVTDPRYRIPVYDADGNIIRDRQPEYGDIAVLCRANKMCIDIKNEADRYGIPAHLQGDVSIMDTREGKLVLAWLRYINNRTDLRGPVTILADSGYTLAELRAMFPRHGVPCIPDGMERHRETLRTKRRRINDLLTSIFAYHGLNNDITQSIISTISSTHSGSMLTISEMIGLIETDMKRGSRYNVDAPLDGRSVMIQTMHKSKGLEYPIVIVGGLTMSKMPLDKHDDSVIAFDPLYGVRLKNDYVVTGKHHKVFKCWKWNIIDSLPPDRDEERRLFFVALSRARQYITMTCFGTKPSYFIRDVCDGEMTDTDPILEKRERTVTAAVNERPSVPGYEPRMNRISLHDIMGAYEESGGGKGADHGIRVHKDAQRIMSGMIPSVSDDETRYIRKIYDSLKGAEILTETDCSLPMKDTVIAGRIDMLAIFKDRVEVHDFKTDMNRDNEPRYRIQMSVYAHAASSLGKPVVCVIDYVSQGISVTVEPIGIDEIYQRIASFAGG